MRSRPVICYPFSAIVGQETLRTALLVNAVDERVGGLLIRGQKGTAKSTAVRALAAVLPDIDVVEDCRYGCDPAEPSSWCHDCRHRCEQGHLPKTSRRPHVVDLPVSATEDRLVGTLDLEHALKHGERVFEPGLLADANRGILYVDEVNLLDDHLVDTLLDAAAMGVNVVQREGVAFSHPSSFILVGTMNPEEGEVRPQLLDRFGLCVEVAGISDPHVRVEIVKRRRDFEEDAGSFARRWSDEEAALETRLRHARLRVESVRLPEEILLTIATLCADAGVDGHRADITLSRAAAALAALDDVPEVSLDHVRRMAPLVLAHRMRKSPFEGAEETSARLRAALAAVEGGDDGPSDERGVRGPDGSEESPASPVAVREAVALEERPEGAAATARLVTPLDKSRRAYSGRRQETLSDDRRGRHTRTELPSPGRDPDIALDATIRAAAPFQRARDGATALELRSEDIRTKVRRRRVGASIVFCVDASGSMGAARRMDTARSALLELLTDAYQRRDRVGLVSFRGDGADVVLTPTGSVELARLRLRDIAVGGATPLAHGIVRSLELLDAERRRSEDIVPWLVLVTDGRANVGLSGNLGSEDAREMATRARQAKVNTLVIDTDTGPGRNGAARDIARAAGGEYVRLGRFDAGSVAGAVRQHVHE